MPVLYSFFPAQVSHHHAGEADQLIEGSHFSEQILHEEDSPPIPEPPDEGGGA
jgi:cobalt-zinc-cadmium resistance protein CzcA